MSFLRPKIDLFSSFSGGLEPLYMERIFDSLLTLQGVKDVVRMGAKNRLEHYLDYLQKKTSYGTREEYMMIQFYKGHVYQKLAAHTASQVDAWHFREKSLCTYQSYFELEGLFQESKFYAHWQIGLLLDILNYPWLLAEESLLLASATDPSRGESLKMLTAHYCHEHQWNRAHVYSLLAPKKLFAQSPAAWRTWFVDFDAYNWKVLHTHLRISYKLGYMQDGKEVYYRILSHTGKQPEKFNELNIRRLHSLEKLFFLSNPKLASAS